MDLAKALGGIEQTAAEKIKAEDGDYVQDGLLYCGKCNTPKQARVKFFGRERTPYCLCQCAVEARGTQRDEQRKAEKQVLTEQRRRAGFPDRELMDCTFGNDDGGNERITKAALNYVEHFSRMLDNGKGLLLFGGVGTGKTYIAACIANALIDKGYACLVTNFARLVNTIGGMYDGKQEYIDGLNQYDLLVIDDLGAERDTEYMGEIVQNIVDSRYRAGLPLIVTTNLTSEELKNATDIKKQRLYSRLLEMCLPVEMTGKDRRKEKLKTEYSDYKKLLEL